MNSLIFLWIVHQHRFLSGVALGKRCAGPADHIDLSIYYSCNQSQSCCGHMGPEDRGKAKGKAHRNAQDHESR